MGEIKRLTKFKSKMDYQVKENGADKITRVRSKEKMRSVEPSLQEKGTRKSESGLKKRPTSSNKKLKLKKILKTSESVIIKGKERNLFLTNCDTWQKVHCHKPKHHANVNLPRIPSAKINQRSSKKSRSRSRSNSKSVRN